MSPSSLRGLLPHKLHDPKVGRRTVIGVPDRERGLNDVPVAGAEDQLLAPR
jgi:hypothetical protein